jgi:hypothetical protein
VLQDNLAHVLKRGRFDRLIPMIRNDGWTAEQAFREMKQYEFGWDFLHPEFKKFVYAYDAQGDRSAPIRQHACGPRNPSTRARHGHC